MTTGGALCRDTITYVQEPSFCYLHGGPGYNIGLEASGSLTLDHQGLSRGALGLDGRTDWDLGGDTTLSASAGIARRTVVESEASSLWANYARLGVIHQVTDDITAGVRLSRPAPRPAARVIHIGGLGPELFVQIALGDDLSIEVTYGISRLAYDDTITLFMGDRVDIRGQFGVDLSYDLEALSPTWR